MAFDTRLRMLQTQRMIMTPMLQQAISLLQLSRLELVQELRQQMEENPLLEEALEGIEEPQASLEQDFQRIETLASNFKRNREYLAWLQELRNTIYWESRLEPARENTPN